MTRVALSDVREGNMFALKRTTIMTTYSEFWLFAINLISNQQTISHGLGLFFH